MPPKQRITREMILETSFAMFCREGMEVVNARSVAKALNCSTQPIFSYFSGMEDLKTALADKARNLFEEEIVLALSGEEPLLGSCLAYYRFAVKQPNLFRFLFLSKKETADIEAGGVGCALREQVLDVVCSRKEIDRAAAQESCAHLWIFAHGLASLQAMGLMDKPQEQVEQMLADVRKRLAD